MYGAGDEFSGSGDHLAGFAPATTLRQLVGSFENKEWVDGPLAGMELIGDISLRNPLPAVSAGAGACREATDHPTGTQMSTIDEEAPIRREAPAQGYDHLCVARDSNPNVH
jgi:hypothetical protein